jgi:hypothetical protein
MAEERCKPIETTDCKFNLTPDPNRAEIAESDLQKDAEQAEPPIPAV